MPLIATFSACLRSVMSVTANRQPVAFPSLSRTAIPSTEIWIVCSPSRSLNSPLCFASTCTRVNSLGKLSAVFHGDELRKPPLDNITAVMGQ